MSAVVTVYLYPAGVATTYKGAFLAGFMGERGHETKVDQATKPGERPSFTAVAGTVTSIPGNYQFRLALFAVVPGHTDPHQFQQSIPIEVVAG